MTWVIDSGDDRGVPVTAHCEECGEQWLRPAYDPQADTLPMFARAHNQAHREHARRG